MTRLAWLAGAAGIIAIALLVVFRGQAAASDSPSCSQVDGYLSFCLNVPTSSVRRETTVPLVTLPSQRADVRVEVAVPGSEAVAVAGGVDRSVERVEKLFGQTFSARPRVLLFATNASFAKGAAELFGYSPETAAYVASTYGGIFDRGTLTIAVNWSSGGPSRMQAAIEHELTHLMIREVAGGADLPIWLDEGIATLVEENAAGSSIWVADESLTGRAVAANRMVSLDEVTSLSDWHATYARLGRPLYAFAADTVRAMEGKIGWDGVLWTLGQIGAGRSFDDAYLTASGETVTGLEQRNDGDVAAVIVVTSSADASGNLHWTLFAGAPGTEVQVSISGGRDYDLTFTIATDALGMYRGSFGSTAAPGAYTVRAAGASAMLVTAR